MSVIDDVLLGDLFDESLTKEYPELKRFKLSSTDLICTSIDQGLLDEIWEDDSDTGNRRYGRTTKINYFESCRWGQWLCDPEINNPRSHQGKRFRRNFRLPYPVFANYLVPECKRLNVFEVKDPARVRVPIEIKVLICLRVLGRGAYNEDVADMSLCFRSSINFILRKFLNNFVPQFFDVFVTPPTGDRLKKVMAAYSKLGFPGAMGSMDVTHIPWGKCPQKWQNLASGKAPYPTVAFNCVVDRSYTIHSVSPILLGGTNDITASRVDPYTQRFTLGRYKNIKYHIFVGKNKIACMQGGYLITDGGYPKINAFICPLHHRVDRAATLFSEYMESTRKDVECTFGQLKARWRVLKKPLEVESILEVENIFKCCCILHNMIIVYEGRDITEWELDIDWEMLEPDAVDLDVDEDNINDMETIIPRREEDDFDIPQMQLQSTHITKLDPNNDHYEFVLKLCASFEYQFDMGFIQWPRNFSAHQKAVMPINRIARIAARANSDMYDTLIIKQSCLLIMDRKGNYTKHAGTGLFAGMNYKVGDDICAFKQGERISATEYNDVRVPNGEGGYAIRINNAEYMDNYKIRNSCKASMANDPRHAWNTKTKSVAKANSRISRRITATNANFKLKAITNIKIGEEIITDYLDEFIMPDTDFLDDAEENLLSAYGK